MFSQVFQFFINCFRQIFSFFKNVTIDKNFTYYDFLFCLALSGITLLILKSIRGDIEQDHKFLDYMDRVERYKENKKKMHRENFSSYTERKRNGSDD